MFQQQLRSKSHAVADTKSMSDGRVPKPQTFGDWVLESSAMSSLVTKKLIAIKEMAIL